MTAAIDPKYSIGVPEMDAQHAQWIHYIDEFRKAATGHIRDEEAIRVAEETLEQLLAYTERHFASEEHFLAAHHYPGLDAHKRKHAELKAEVVKLLAEVRAHAVNTTPLKLNLFATVWLMDHIMHDDYDYARFLRRR